MSVDIAVAVYNQKRIAYGGIKTDAQQRAAMGEVIAALGFGGLKDFAESIKVYVVDGDEQHLHVKVGDSVVAVMRINSPEAVLWLHLEQRRKAVLAKANGGTS